MANKLKYGCLRNKPVYLMDKATKVMKLENGQIAVQSLLTGDTAIVKKSQVKKFSTKYPKSRSKC